MSITVWQCWARFPIGLSVYPIFCYLYFCVIFVYCFHILIAVSPCYCIVCCTKQLYTMLAVVILLSLNPSLCFCQHHSCQSQNALFRGYWSEEGAGSGSSKLFCHCRTRNILDDFREAYYWLRQNTEDKARVMSWWDYGYQIAGMGNRTTLVDNNTWNNSHIALVIIPRDQADYQLQLSTVIGWMIHKIRFPQHTYDIVRVSFVLIMQLKPSQTCMPIKQRLDCDFSQHQLAG